MTTPMSSYDYDMKTRSKTLVKREEVLGGFDPANYVTERLHATAADGMKVPISIVYRKGFAQGRQPPAAPVRIRLLWRDAWTRRSTPRGSACSTAASPTRSPTSAAARSWAGPGTRTASSSRRRTRSPTSSPAPSTWSARSTPGRTASSPMGGSAGGLLMGAVVNMRPDLFKGVIAAVPFVDVVTTMLDPSIPLTTFEYDEWGNPNDRTYFDYMLSYSPYDNVEAKAYPNLLVTTSLQDSQVQYWEPAKWVAKLRATKTDANRLLLRTYKQGSHGGVSGRYRRYRETAFIYAFLLDLAGIAQLIGNRFPSVGIGASIGLHTSRTNPMRSQGNLLRLAGALGCARRIRPRRATPSANRPRILPKPGFPEAKPNLHQNLIGPGRRAIVHHVGSSMRFEATCPSLE